MKGFWKWCLLVSEHHFFLNMIIKEKMATFQFPYFLSVYKITTPVLSFYSHSSCSYAPPYSEGWYLVMMVIRAVGKFPKMTKKMHHIHSFHFSLPNRDHTTDVIYMIHDMLFMNYSLKLLNFILHQFWKTTRPRILLMSDSWVVLHFLGNCLYKSVINWHLPHQKSCHRRNFPIQQDSFLHWPIRKSESKWTVYF